MGAKRGGRYVELPAAQSPQGHRDPRGATEWAACSLAMRSSARFPASHFRVHRHRHRQIVEGGLKGRSVRVRRSSGRPARGPAESSSSRSGSPSVRLGRPSTSRPGRGPVERSSRRSGSPSVRVSWPARSRAGRKQQPPIRKSVRSSLSGYSEEVRREVGGRGSF